MFYSVVRTETAQNRPSVGLHRKPAFLKDFTAADLFFALFKTILIYHSSFLGRRRFADLRVKLKSGAVTNMSPRL